MFKGNTKPSIDFLDSFHRPASKKVDELYQTMAKNDFQALGLMAERKVLPQSCISSHGKPHESGRSDKQYFGRISKFSSRRLN